MAANQLVSPDYPLLPWAAGAALWFLLTILLDILVLKSPRAAVMLVGTPTVLIENGRILEKNLRSNYMRADDLMAQLRAQGYFNPADIEFAVLESNGRVSVLPRSQKRPVQPEDLGISTPYEGMVRELVVDREVIRQNLRQLRLSEEWLRDQLLARGMSPGDVFFASLDTQGHLFVDGYTDPVPGSRAHVNDYTGPH